MKKKYLILRAMGDETRIKILQYLMNGEQCACTIVPFTGKAQPTVSQHMKILLQAGIVGMRKDGTRILYRIKDERAVQIMEILGIKRMVIENIH
jgi:DNA-binding transcriptional ArsR family regulator